MRIAVAAACAVSAIAACAETASAQSGAFNQPSCVASTLAAAALQTRLIPAEIRSEHLPAVRGVVVRGLTWSRGQKIRVCFHGGTRKAHERVARVAREWMDYANVAFDFEENGAPRTCKGNNSEDIKVAFVDNQGWWSLPGTASRTQDPSMNLQFYGVDTPKLADGRPADEGRIRATILHEFGHALGLMHEHQSPRGGCDAEIDWTEAYKLGASMGWDRSQVDRNFRQLANAASLNATEVDRKSIMHYSLPPILFKRGKNSACYVPDNLELSEQDRTFIASIYPKPDSPMVVSSGPTGAVTRGGKPKPAAPGEDRQALVKRYEDLLKQAGVETGKAKALASEFRKSATGR